MLKKYEFMENVLDSQIYVLLERQKTFDRVIGLNQVESKRNIMIKEIVKNHLMQKKFKKKDKE